jgi:sec-independent protein translocase protein TatB
MFFGLTVEKLLVIGVIAAVIMGPERLPRAAQALREFVVRAREFLQGARTRMREEMGPDFDDVDWRRLDPRQYDPRRIIREALLDDAPVATVRAAGVAGAVTGAGVAAASTPVVRPEPFRSGEAPPYDAEAT